MSSTLEMPPVMAQQKGWIDFPPAPERISDLGIAEDLANDLALKLCLLYTSPSPRDGLLSRMPSSA